MAEQLYQITFTSTELNTVKKFLDAESSPAHSYFNKPDTFLKLKGTDGLTNRERIQNAYKLPEDLALIGSDYDKLPIKFGTVLYIEYKEVNAVSFLAEGINVVSNDTIAFKAQKLAELEADKGYVSIIKPTAGKVQSGTIKTIYSNVTVWAWCRSLSGRLTGSSQEELKGEFVDLTPFLIKCTTNMSKTGGNFQLTLPPIVCELDENDRWVLKKKSILRYTDQEQQGYVAEDSLFDENLNKNQFWFNNVLKPNDVIFIRFETLEMEKDQRYSDSINYFIDKKNIANRIYDMIGLVDSNVLTFNPAANDATITIAGRDLSKLFIEDGNYFYALEFAGTNIVFAGQATQKSSLLNRVYAERGMSFIGLYMFTSIEYILKYIIQQLANIKIVPNDLFESYGDRRSTKYREVNFDAHQIGAKKKPDYKPEYKKELAEGIFQLVDLLIDKSVANRRLADSSYSTAQGSLLNHIKSVAQQPLVEHYGDTYGDKYTIIVRKPPYDRKAVVSLLNGRVNTEQSEETASAVIDIEAEDVIQESLIMNDEQVYSWYRFYAKGAMLNDRANYSLTYLPAIFFPEYAEVFGSHSYDQCHSYIPYLPFQKDTDNIVLQQSIEDLKYVIDSSQYLPFTRKGTLVLNGDRRIKIGNMVRYKPTGEIFYVESVQQNIQINDNSIDRTTTVQLTRGMVEQLIYGIPYYSKSRGMKYISYFNIINTELNYKEKEVTTEKVTRKKVGKKKVKSVPAQSTVLNASIIHKSNMVVCLDKLEKLNDHLQNKNTFIRFINAINEHGYEVTLCSTFRTAEEQAILKRQNKNNASVGNSSHEYGAAIDINIRNARSGKSYRKNTSEEEWRATGVPAIANSFGLQWGGKENNGAFGDYVDRGHFSISNNSVSELIDVDDYQEFTEFIKTKALDFEGVFNNFKVDRFIFNFFLKNLQFDPQYREVNSKVVYKVDGNIFNG